MAPCAWCGRPLAPSEARFVPPAARYALSAAPALAHAGMWAMERLSRPYCARHRALIAALGAGVLALGAAAVVLGTALALRALRGS